MHVLVGDDDRTLTELRRGNPHFNGNGSRLSRHGIRGDFFFEKRTGGALTFIMRGLKPILLILGFTFFLNIFMVQGHEIFRWHFIKITVEGIYTAAFMATRLILLIISSSLLTLTTKPIALTDGIEKIMRPLSVIGIPAHEIAMMMSIALRFIPTLLEETDKIMKAQQARGADFESGNLIRRAKSMVPILVPLFVSAFRMG